MCEYPLIPYIVTSDTKLPWNKKQDEQPACVIKTYHSRAVRKLILKYSPYSGIHPSSVHHQIADAIQDVLTSRYHLITKDADSRY